MRFWPELDLGSTICVPFNNTLQHKFLWCVYLIEFVLLLLLVNIIKGFFRANVSYRPTEQNQFGL